MVTIRPADARDSDRIAVLHADSWRASYRGQMADAYLDGPVFDERRLFWRERLGHRAPDLVTLVAEDDSGALAGFVCARTHHDPVWGTLVDNLHVAPDRKGGGLGRRLMRTMAEALSADDARGPVYLFVLAANTAAAGFYARLGGGMVEDLVTEEPDGSRLPVRRIAWDSLAAFLAGAA